MKNIIRLLLLVALLALAGIATAETAREVTTDAKFSVPYNNNTIRRMRDRDRLTAMQAGAQKNPTVTILYPDGVTYRGNDQSSGYTGTLNGEKYAAGDVLVNIVRKFYTAKVVKPNVLCVIFSLLLAGYGIAAIADPEFVWMMGHMFQSHWYQSTDPTEEGLRMTRIRGVATIIIGVVIFLMDWK